MDSQSAVADGHPIKAARGSPVADPVLEPATAALPGAAAGGAIAPESDADADALSDAMNETGPDAPSAAPGEDDALRPAAQEPPNGSPSGLESGPAPSADGQQPGQDIQGADGSGEDEANPGNLGPHGEPGTPAGRPTDVTATLSESDVLLQDVPADEARAPDTFATSAFAAEEPRQPVAWAAADVVTEIYHGHYNQLVRLAVLLVHDVQTAEEVVQDAFEAMHLASKRLRETEKALQYLRQSVVNRSRSVLRHRKVVDMHAPKPSPDEPSAEHAALALLERSAVAAALRSLPERQREAIALRYYADFSEADIAKAMGISKGAVKSHTARAMSSLKTILSQETP